MSPSLGPRSWSPNPQIYTRVILGLIIPGIGLTTILLALYGYAAWSPISRRYLDRVSFRLLVYALVAHVLFGVLFTVGALAAYPGWRCSLLSFLTNLSLMFSVGMFLCIALNLPLVIAYNVNGVKTEKYYLLGTVLVCLICNIAPYATGNLGWDDVNETCWYRSTDPRAMLRWLIGTQIVWIMLSAVGEVGAFLIVGGYLILSDFDMRQSHRDTLATYSSEASRRPGSTILRFRTIILRIGLYPLVSCILNISSFGIDLYESRNYAKHPESAELNWRLHLAGLSINAGRPLIYGLLAATDPSFLRALRALRHPEAETATQSHWPAPGGRLSTFIDLPPDATIVDLPPCKTSSDTDAWTGELEKDDVRGYGRHAQLRAGETSTMSVRANLEKGKGKERRLDEGHNQRRATMSALPRHF